MHEEGIKTKLSNQISHHVSERVKLYEESMKRSASPSHLKNNKNNNIRCVVPVGVLIVLFTLYLTTTAIKLHYGNHGEPEEGRYEEVSRARKERDTQETLNRIKILEKLLEYKDLCTELEVFTKDLRWVSEVMVKDQFDTVEAECGKNTKETMETSGSDNECINEELTDHDKSKSSRRNGHRRIAMRNTKIKNKNSKNNHSIINNNGKKDQPKVAKKSNTAEPIIYLFALVFIYLLLKAASDINQHYKSQNKGDKRLRRCSLQSYAQTHKQDRRASKDTSNKRSNRELLLEMRSKSVDRFNETTMKKSEILSNLRKFTSFDEQNRLVNPQNRVPGLARQPTWESENCREAPLRSLESITPNVSNRRCSVPVAVNFQRHSLRANLLPNSGLARRTSLSGVYTGAEPNLCDYGQDMPFHEIKRRVRMINRH